MNVHTLFLFFFFVFILSMPYMSNVHAVSLAVSPSTLNLPANTVKIMNPGTESLDFSLEGKGAWVNQSKGRLQGKSFLNIQVQPKSSTFQESILLIKAVSNQGIAPAVGVKVVGEQGKERFKQGFNSSLLGLGVGIVIILLLTVVILLWLFLK
jgi:hypothetical protein